MGRAEPTLKLIIIAIFLSFVAHNVECSDVKFYNHYLEVKQSHIINDVGISSEFEYGISKTDVVCNDTSECSHGGTCYNGTCICLPGTSGPLCETINACGDLSCDKDKNATCSFDTKNFKAYCKCPFGQEFDYEESKCKDCLCEEDPFCLKEHSCLYQVKCEFIRSEKTCTCKMPYVQFNPKKAICEFCSCGLATEDCYFDDDGKQRCKCIENYAERSGICQSCKCYDSVGCRFNGREKVCVCRDGYAPFQDACYRCSCGENGKCLFSSDPDWRKIKQTGCSCDPGYVEMHGVCEEISECYCGENSNCTLINGEKNCTCQNGFTNVNGLCTDINECDFPKICPKNTICYNLIGSYECSCADGFQPSKEQEGECEDIDECQEGKPCTDKNTQCFNTPGSYRCVCDTGFATREGLTSNPICEDKSTWRMGFGILIGIFLAIIIGLGIIIYRKKT